MILLLNVTNFDGCQGADICLFYFGPSLFPAAQINGGSWYKHLMNYVD